VIIKLLELLGTIIQQTFLGITLGALFALIAIGFNLSFGLARIINIAHAGFYALAAYLTFTLVKLIGEFIVSVLISATIVSILSIPIERYLISKLYGKHIDLSLVVGFGVLFIVSSLIRYIWGLEPKSISPPPYISGQLFIGRIIIPVYYIFVTICSAIIFLLIWLVINKTMIGRIVKASIDDLERVCLLGINVYRIFTINYIISSFLAGLGGGIVAPLISIHPAIGPTIILICFSIVVVGGMGSIFGTLFAGIIVGLTISYTAILNPSIAEGVAYLLMAVVLIFRPQGIFGK